MTDILWILTIGSSDIQLESKATTQERKKSPADVKRLNSDQVWKSWYDSKFQSQIRAEYGSLVFKPTPTDKDKDATYRIETRLLGRLYQSCQDDIQDEIWSYLTFPLLNNFVDELNKAERQKPNKIALILTDQSAIFTTKQDRKEKSPYWQDTCLLEAILERYFQSKYPDAEILKFQQDSESEPQSITLKPNEDAQGLDNWNSVLELVRTEFKRLYTRLEKDKAEPELVYVSHQAGTPALSSAVQFCSLATYGDRVKFLVSNEYNPTLPEKPLEGSSYLRGIRIQEAKALLDNHNYAGVKDLLNSYLEDEKHQEIKTLLDAAIQWNFAHFAEGYNLIKGNKLVKKDDRRRSFVEILSQNPGFRDPVAKRTANDKWWWAAYEAAYLSFIRLKQGNTVEVVFHSFRAVEGLIKTWAEINYPRELENTKHPKHQENSRWDRNLRLYGEDLYTFLNMKRNIDKSKDFDIWVFGNVVIKRRNDLFHKIKGLNDQENVFETWRSSNERQWKDNAEEIWKCRVLNCLNFIVREDFPEGFKLEEASLMVKVHQELVEAIADL